MLTTKLAKTHTGIAGDRLDAPGMLRLKGRSGARTPRRGLSDSALSEARRQLGDKTGWYGSTLVVVDRWAPSSKICYHCQVVQDIGWAECPTREPSNGGCGLTHRRDDNAAINRARYEGAGSRPLASSAQSGPPASVEPTVRPGLVGQAATKRGRDVGTRLLNNPVTGRLG